MPGDDAGSKFNRLNSAAKPRDAVGPVRHAGFAFKYGSGQISAFDRFEKAIGGAE